MGLGKPFEWHEARKNVESISLEEVWKGIQNCRPYGSKILTEKRNCPILFLCFDPPGKEPSIQLISRSSLVWIQEADRKHTIENTFVSLEARVWILLEYV